MGGRSERVLTIHATTHDIVMVGEGGVTMFRTGGGGWSVLGFGFVKNVVKTVNFSFKMRQNGGLLIQNPLKCGLFLSKCVKMVTFSF